MADENIPESSAESKARHTPGPFHYPHYMIEDKRAKSPHAAIVCDPRRPPGSDLGREITDLLNKGTHFDEMLSFIRDDLSDMADALPGHETHPLEKQRLALIAKAEGTDD